MPATPTSAGAIREEADGGIDKGIDQQGQHDHEADGCRRHADHLIVEQQKKGAEP
jgi:hypothetical protein